MWARGKDSFSVFIPCFSGHETLEIDYSQFTAPVKIIKTSNIFHFDLLKRLDYENGEEKVRNKLLVGQMIIY